MNANLKTLSLFTAAGGLVAAAMLLGADEPPKPIVDMTPPPPPIEVPVADRPVVQIALLLDTSSSMDGLIEQAKSQLWKIVNSFDPATVNGQRPHVQIAVYEYGNDGLSAASGYIRRVLPFSEELDRASEALFSLTTNGGNEYAGLVIQTALEQLEWSKNKDALKFVFIAGNEPFDQGNVSPNEAIAKAAKQGVIVNTIYCGDDGDMVALGWKNGAVLADGRFMTINQNQKVVHIDAPQDKAIAELGVELNGTYIPFGSRGYEGAQRQVAEDMNSATVGQGSAVQRSMFKASRNYMNTSWELGDALSNGKLKWSDVKEDSLPDAMKGMSQAERETYVKEQLAKRKTLQAKIRDLGQQRDAFVAKKRAEMAQAGEETLDLAMINAVKDQASKKGYKFQ